MSWIWRKPERKADTADPQIQNARRILQDERKGKDSRSSTEHAEHLPGAIDSDFCYGEDISPCA